MRADSTRIFFYKIGNFDPLFHHDLGDVDYGLRALKSNINILTTRVVIGSCIENNICRVRKNSTTLINRFKILYSPLGSPPRLNFYFRKQHFGLSITTLIDALIYFGMDVLPEIKKYSKWNEQPNIGVQFGGSDKLHYFF